MGGYLDRNAALHVALRVSAPRLQHMMKENSLLLVFGAQPEERYNAKLPRLQRREVSAGARFEILMSEPLG